MTVSSWTLRFKLVEIPNNYRICVLLADVLPKYASNLSIDKWIEDVNTHTEHSGILVQSPGCVQLFMTPWTATHQASLSLTISLSFPKFMSIASVIPSNHLLLCCPLLLLPSLFTSIRAWRVSCSHQVAKVLGLQHQSLPKMEKVYTVSKKKTWSDCSSDHQLLLTKFRPSLKKAGKTSRPTRCDLNPLWIYSGSDE